MFMSSRKKIVCIWANCQGGVVSGMLSRYYSSLFTIYNDNNYEYIQSKKPIPNYLKNCDIFLYQNYSDREDGYDLNFIKKNILPNHAITISFPTLHRNYLQFPFDAQSPENTQTVDDKHPHGKFFFGIQNIRNIVYELKKNKIEDSKIIDIVLNKINNIDFIDVNQIKENEERTLNFLKNKSLSSDIPEIYDFIVNNYKKQRLWHNPNHPNGILLNELCKLIFNKLGLVYPNEKQNINYLDKQLNDWKMPIFKSVERYYNMNNVDNKCFCWVNNKIVDLNTYIIEYVKFIIRHIQL